MFPVAAVLADGSSDISAIADSSALGALVILLGASAVAAWWTTRTRTTGHGFVGWLCGFGSIAVIVAVTMFRDGLDFGFRPGRTFEWSWEGWSRLSGDTLSSSQFVLNMVLFVPAGAAWTWLTRRPLDVTIAAAAATIVIESLEGVTGVGRPDVADVAANSVGGALGAVLAVLVGRWVAGHPPRWSQRTQRLASGAAAVLTALIVIGWFVGADRRQSGIESELREAFAGTTLEEIEPMLVGEDADRRAIRRAISAQSDGVRSTDEQIEVRYPATFYALHRCVFVMWTPGTVAFRPTSGDECVEFISWRAWIALNGDGDGDAALVAP